MKITPKLIGRFGNQMFIYAHARAVAEQYGHELRTEPWIGQKIFQIDDPLADGSEEQIGGYRQAQEDLIYSRADCLRWFKLRPEIEAHLYENGIHRKDLLAHHRTGDYIPTGYPVVSRQSYEWVAALLYPGWKLKFVSEEKPHKNPHFDWAPFLPDFYRMMMAPILLRANSSFSYWAAVLNVDGFIRSPVIDGLEGGKEHDNVAFVRGNWPRLANHAFTTDLHLRCN